MNFQEKVREFNQKTKSGGFTPEVAFLDLISELGEVSKEITKSTDYGAKKPEFREEIKEELGDAFYSLVMLAEAYHINLEEALELALKKYEKRIASKGDMSSGR